MDENKRITKLRLFIFVLFFHESVLIAIMEIFHWIEKFFPYRSHAIYFIYPLLILNFAGSLISLFSR